MNWRISQQQSRSRYLNKYSAAAVDEYDQWTTSLSPADNLSYLEDILECCPISSGQKILELGAGTGGFTLVLKQVCGISLTAVEPSPEMLLRLKSKADLRDIPCIQSFCDHISDRSLFAAESFDIIASRQLFNGLFDPIAALENTLFWLKPHGRLIVTDGLYDRSAWTGIWEEEVDCLPLSACRNIAMLPYLMEKVGFHVTHAPPMDRTDQRTSTKTPRYIAVGCKIA